MWCVMHWLGINESEWLVQLCSPIRVQQRRRVGVGDMYIDVFGVGVGVHNGSVSLSSVHYLIIA